MQATGFIPSFSMSTFAQSISSPYTSFKAYQSGAIDANGNLLRPESSIDDYEYFIIKLKKIFEEIPMSYTKSRLNSYASTFQMFTEEALKHGLNKIEFLFFIDGYLSSKEEINEDMTTGAAAGGIGKPIPHENTGEVSGYDPMLGAPMFRRAGNVEMFDVSPQEFSQFKIHKAWKHLPDSETKRYLQRFQRRNKDAKMAVRSLNKDNGKYDVHWVKMKPMSFMEEFHLDFLFENGGAVKNYTDTVNDPERNVAVETNAQEKHRPVEVNQRNIDDVVTGAQEAVRMQKNRAGRAEKEVNYQDTISSLQPLMTAAKSGSDGEEYAAKVLGLISHLGGRSVSSSDPFDTARAIIDPTTPSGMRVILRDVKTPTATAAVQTRNSEVEFPLVGGIPADEAVRELKKSGRDEKERHRITDEIIKPFINRPIIRAALGRDLMRFQREKGIESQQLLDPSEAITGQMAVSLAGGPRANPLDVDMPTFVRDLESSKWRFGVKKGGSKYPSYTPTAYGGKYSAYSGSRTPTGLFELDPAILQNLSAQTAKSVRDYFAKLRV